eukprot:SAG22_NODE_530_length_9427_cov_3.306818_4_plen_63_part_00
MVLSIIGKAFGRCTCALTVAVRCCTSSVPRLEILHGGRADDDEQDEAVGIDIYGAHLSPTPA